MMANKHEVIHLYNKHKDWNAYDIATFLGCTSGYVRATLQRAKLPPRYRQRVSRTAVVSAEELAERAERERDQRDLDILSDLQDGHSQRDCAKFYGVSPTYVHNLSAAREGAR